MVTKMQEIWTLQCLGLYLVKYDSICEDVTDFVGVCWWFVRQQLQYLAVDFCFLKVLLL